MADVLKPEKKQSLLEVRIWPIDFGPDLKNLTSVTVSATGHTATHTPPAGGTAVTPTIDSVSGSVINVKLPALGASNKLGLHYLDVRASLSDGQKSDVRIEIDVIF